MDLRNARRLKELERENTELKKMLGEQMLKNRVLEEVNKKMVSSRHKQEAVKHVVTQGFCSLRRVCRYLGLDRSTYLYERKRESYCPQTTVRRIIRLSKAH